MVGKLIVRSNQEEGTIAQGEEETVIVNDGYQEFDEETMKRAVAEGQKVALFFHADWCPSCIALNENIVENEDTIENGTVVFKVDYDTAKDLTDKYNVTAQHTVVYLDEDMNATMTKGGVTSLDELVGNFDA
jgi:thiol-disulfide isomerase/thioredoxin